MEKFDNCSCAGANLDKLIQPATLTLLVDATLHGYVIVQKLRATCILQGKKPDPTGVYRCLRLMEQRGLVTAAWDVAESGPAKRLYAITESGVQCLRKWAETLENYHEALGQFLVSLKLRLDRDGRWRNGADCGTDKQSAGESSERQVVRP